jgi:hypothetical protein
MTPLTVPLAVDERQKDLNQRNAQHVIGLVLSWNNYLRDGSHLLDECSAT